VPNHRLEEKVDESKVPRRRKRLKHVLTTLTERSDAVVSPEQRRSEMGIDLGRLKLQVAQGDADVLRRMTLKTVVKIENRKPLCRLLHISEVEIGMEKAPT